MRSRYVGVGIFVVVGSLLFATTVFLIGNQHNFFSKHIELFTEVKNLNGLRTEQIGLTRKASFGNRALNVPSVRSVGTWSPRRDICF